MKSCELLNALVAALTMASAQVDEAPAQSVIEPAHIQVSENRPSEPRPRLLRRAAKPQTAAPTHGD
ncbi:hypothetical protein AZSI13_10970 [Azospira sp. I13]|uniref:hypothetical protein n=1 Tax=Azospira sp. I13 TaxID=1765050 RepID=UPI000D4F60B5|nr:hypothetical protein [Azospira sp. I13]GBG01770.1 hypothetical protein AZSI13_10970 [Azospira sp. I13]